jgi:molybdenum cofactor biosynthesis protein A
MHKTNEKIVDKFGRIHDYLRISLTERCNLRCFYCMPEEGIELRDKAEFMSIEETLELARTFIELGVKKIRLTGGEPLIKKNVEYLLLELGKLPVELSITTNAVVVDKFIEVFKEAGIKKLNVSLDSLSIESFNKISRRNYADRIMKNIDLLLQHNFEVKINVVLIKGVNDHEIIDFIKWSADKDLNIRFIEFMPFDGNNWNYDKTVSFDEITQLVETSFGKNQLQKIKDKPNDTARNFKVKGFKGSFGIISTITNPFCDTCNRIRLTADGKVKNCLFSAEESDLLKSLREGKDVKQQIMDAIYKKHEKKAGIGDFKSEEDQLLFTKNRSMTTIGG